MARPKKDAAVDTSERVNLTYGTIERLTCPSGKQQVFLRDSQVPGLRVRVTAAGAKSFVFEAKLNRQTIRRTIGDVKVWSIDQAREEARSLAVTLDKGDDPRELERQRNQAREALRQQEETNALTFGQVWAVYLEERRPFWGRLHYESHLEKASPGGVPSKRRGMTGQLTKPGPLAEFLPLPLKSIDSATIEAWAAREGKVRPSSARLAQRQLSVFLNWCAEHPQYADLVPDRNPAKSKKTKEALGRQKPKNDCLQREQLPAWFTAIRQIKNPIISAALQVMLLTGARPNEVLSLQWDDINWQWRGMHIRDKVEGDREIPLTPYVASLMQGLPKRNAWVFSSTRTLAMDEHNIRRRATKAAKRGTDAPDGDVLETSGSGRITTPNTAHTRACTAVGIDGLTLHGLRRSFASLTEWLEIPAGVVAQIQGHKPSATAEKHYKRRPLDLLRVHHERIEAWMLEQAAVAFKADSTPAPLRSIA